MPFRLDLLRHGEALAARGDGDAARALSEAGRRTVARIAEEYERRGWHPARVFTSPMRRAQETAAIVIARAAPGIEPETLDELVPDHGPEDVVAALNARDTAGHVLLVGHQPQLGGLAAYLTGGPEPGMAPGALACLEIAGLPGRGSGRMLWLLHPDHLP